MSQATASKLLAPVTAAVNVVQTRAVDVVTTAAIPQRNTINLLNVMARLNVIRSVSMKLSRARCLSRLRRHPHRLNECAVSGGVPDGKSHPRFAGGIERNREMLRAERRQIGG